MAGELTLSTKDALGAVYRERAQLVALLASVYPSHIGPTDPDEPEWEVVVIDLPTGQASWHIAPIDRHLFNHVRVTCPDDAPWDGHTTEEKYRRVQAAAQRCCGGRCGADRTGDSS